MPQKGPARRGRAKLVYGESAEAIVQALESGKLGPGSSEGVRRLRVTAAPDAVTPLIRAVLRAEAELLLEEADLFDVGTRLATGDELQAMAVYAVALAAAKATGGAPPGL